MHQEGRNDNLGKVGKGVSCSVRGCPNEAERSMSKAQLSASSLAISTEGRRTYLCRDHYKEWKKETKKSRTLERARWS